MTGIPDGAYPESPSYHKKTRDQPIQLDSFHDRPYSRILGTLAHLSVWASFCRHSAANLLQDQPACFLYRCLLLRLIDN